ncbi:MAG: 6-phosphogluconolactonase/glucosamine-6-phosphate isomerase/deaminase [Marmoricola sp.]|nr:6-phosphogluconolactonase/glucosamine-6-phosphate isomerase/deaminase [Marmoricola sp.]
MNIPEKKEQSVSRPEVPMMIASSTEESLRVNVFSTANALGVAAADHTATLLREAVQLRGAARVIIATGNSQLSFIKALVEQPDVPWSEVTVFHMDEYIGMSHDHPASFRRWIRERVEEPLRPGVVHYIQGDAPDPEAEADRYEGLLREDTIDLVCLGIGENGHLAFNEPYRADFNDDRWVRTIELDERSVQQQVGEGHFPDARSVPKIALSLTVPALLAPRAVQAVVPELRKAAAVRSSLSEPISNACPATILRSQTHASLWLDADSASLMPRPESAHR